MNKKSKTIYLMIGMLLCLILFITACKKECEHVFDDCADIECNECGEKRDSNHSWTLADCDSPKTCQICGKTEGSALGHQSLADDGDCTTAVKCGVCQKVLVAANNNHTAGKDDGDCTTDVKCAHCDVVVTSGKEAHTPVEDDGDCTTDVKCAHCNVVVTLGKEAHTPVEDDGDCTTEVECSECEIIVVNAKEKHEDTNLDGLCDYCEFEFDYVHDTVTNTYIVFTAEGLYAWEEDNWLGLNLTLAKDIVMPHEMVFDLDNDGINDSNWKSTRTNCTIDGNGYSIIGLVMKSTVENDIEGFISSLDENGVIKNLRIENADINMVGYNIAILVGYNSGTIENCSVSGKIYVEGNNVAGIAGTNWGTIIGCYNEAEVTASVGVIGGIVGQNGSGADIIGCYNVGSITANDSVGGIVGALYYGRLIGCYNTGKIISSTKTEVIMGYYDSDAFIENNYTTLHPESSDYFDATNCIIVDNEIITWANAKEEMNKALTNYEINWRYMENENSDGSPLVITKAA